MKAKFINPFISAAEKLFIEFLELDVKIGNPFLMDGKNDLYEVSAIIGLAGDTQGAVVLSFHSDTAIQMITLFAHHDYKYLTNEVLDGVGEFVNIIVGNAKKDLEDYRISISLPGVVTGKDYRIKWPDGVPIITIPFQSEIGNFTLNVSLLDAI
ncbi:MAG: chemotaxis protein CheX [Spirochaetaceae bacterium]